MLKYKRNDLHEFVKDVSSDELLRHSGRPHDISKTSTLICRQRGPVTSVPYLITVVHSRYLVVGLEIRTCCESLRVFQIAKWGLPISRPDLIGCGLPVIVFVNVYLAQNFGSGTICVASYEVLEYLLDCFSGVVVAVLFAEPALELVLVFVVVHFVNCF